MLRPSNLVLAAAAVLAPMAHVLELPSKLILDGPLWVAIQQHLYRGWGPVFGGPIEVAALATTLALLVIRRGRRETGLLTLAAALAYCGMIVAFQFGREYLDPRKLSLRLGVLQGAMGNGPRFGCVFFRVCSRRLAASLDNRARPSACRSTLI
jgi:hypothetical protein